MSMRDDITRADKARVSWRPLINGEVLVGEVLGLRDVENDYGTAHYLEVIDEQTKERTSVLCRTVLWSEIQRQGTSIGDIIGIKYLGKVGNYYDYVVLVNKPKGGKI